MASANMALTTPDGMLIPRIVPVQQEPARYPGWTGVEDHLRSLRHDVAGSLETVDTAGANSSPAQRTW